MKAWPNLEIVGEEVIEGEERLGKYIVFIFD